MASTVFLVAVLAMMICSGDAQSTNYKNAEHRLLEHLFNNRSPLLQYVVPRDRTKNSSPLKIKFGFHVSYIKDVRASEEEIELLTWFSMNWQDGFLHWNQSEYNVTRVILKAGMFWTPTLAIDKSVDDPRFAYPENTSAILLANGTLRMDHAATVTLRCTMNGCLFPVDSYQCTIRFYLMDYDVKHVILEPDYSMQTNKDPQTGTWALNISSPDASSYKFPYVDYNASYVSYNITLARKSTIFTLTVIVPVSIMTSVAFASILLPPDSGERVSLLVTCLLAQVVYLDTIFDSLPKSSDYVPMFFSWLLVALTFICLQTWLSCLASNWSQATPSEKLLGRASRLIVFGIIGRVLRMPSFHTRCPRTKKVDMTVRDSDQEQASCASVNKTDPDNPELGMDSVDKSNTRPSQGSAKPCESPREETQCAVNILDRLSVFLTITFLSATLFVFFMLFSGKGQEMCAYGQKLSIKTYLNTDT